MFTWRQWKVARGILCNSCTRKVGQFQRENVLKTIEKFIPLKVITKIARQ